MKIINCGSGSKGNSTLIYADNTLILIDAGICLKRVKEGLNLINKTVNDIDFVLISHEHNDHIKHINRYPKEKIYSVKGVLEESIYPNIVELFTPTKFKNLTITFLETSHDSNNSCGFLIESRNESLVNITDTGYIPLKTLEYIKGKNYYIMESNYDELELLYSNRTYELKARILSTTGHLSNELASKYLLSIVDSNLKAIFFAHKSEECNSSNLIEDTFLKEVGKHSEFEFLKDKYYIFLQKEITFYDKD